MKVVWLEEEFSWSKYFKLRHSGGTKAPIINSKCRQGLRLSSSKDEGRGVALGGWCTGVTAGFDSYIVRGNEA